MESKLLNLKTILAEVEDLDDAIHLLNWDQQTQMPAASAERRGYLLSTLHRLKHIRFTSDEVGTLLSDIEPFVGQLDRDSDDARLIKVTRWLYDKKTRVPADLVAELARLTAVAQQAWVEARAEDDFARFQPHLERVMENRRIYAAHFTPYDHVYDPLLDNYEPGLKTAEVIRIFNDLRPHQVELIKAISECPQVENSFLHLDYDERKQWDFGVEVISKFGYDWRRGRQDKSAHPFTSSYGVDDVRITTRLQPDYLGTALFGTLHEAGHALYNQGFSRSLIRTPLEEATSLGVHESQSRLWENLVGRSQPFWSYFYPRLQEIFPSQLGNVSMETFYKGVNKVQPSLIRVEADEATYNLHIMLRLELEIELMEGKLAVKDLPDAWNARMQDYLGLTPPSDSLGVLQDIHWSDGYVGYFPTYALGNLISVQLWECIHMDIPDLDEQMRQGKFESLLIWLREKIHLHGKKYEPQELVQRVTGSKIDPAPYLRYLSEKYRGIYGIS